MENMAYASETFIKTFMPKNYTDVCVQVHKVHIFVIPCNCDVLLAKSITPTAAYVTKLLCY